MSNYCPICEELIFSWEPHVCDPVWNVRIDDKDYNSDPDDEFTPVRAPSAESAACIFAENWDTEDYTLLSGDELLVLVSRPGEPEQMFKVYGQMVSEYWAEAVRATK